VEQTRAIIGLKQRGQLCLEFLVFQVIKLDFNRGIDFFVLKRRRLPDLKDLGKRINMENLDDRFCPEDEGLTLLKNLS